MAADCLHSWNRRFSVLRSDTSGTPLQQPSQLSTISAQSFQSSTEPSDVMNSFCSLLISQGNLPSRLLSVVNLFSILRTSSLYYLLSSSRYPHSFLSNFPNLLVWTLKLCLYNSVRNLPIIHCTVPRIILYSPSMLPTHILCNLLRKLCIPHNLHNSLQVFMCSPSSAQTGIPCASDSSTPPSSGSILATFKFFDLQLGTDASIGSVELSISNYGYPMLFSY